MAHARGRAAETGGKILNMAKSWGKARETTKGETGFGEFVPVPPGSYLMQLVSAEAGTWGGNRKMMLRFVVIGDNEHVGEVCTTFEGFGSEDRDVWMQRLLINLGVEDEVLDGIATEDDLVAAFEGLVAEFAVCKTKVVEKDGYANLRVNKRMDVDEEYLMDPEEVISNLKGQGGDSESDGDSAPDGDEEIEFTEGMEVEFEVDGETVTGKIDSFDDDENAVVKYKAGKRVKKIVLSVDEIEPVDSWRPVPEPEPEPKKKKGPAKKKAGSKKAPPAPEIGIGDRVYVEEYGEDFEGEVGSLPAKGAKVFVQFDDGDKGTFPVDTVHVVSKAAPTDDGDGGDDGDEGGDDEIEVGDRVLFKGEDGEDISGEVKSIDSESGELDVETEDGETWTVPIDEVEFELDEE